MASGNVGWSRSTSARRSTLARREAKFFFEPGDLGGEPPDLGVEPRQLDLVGGLERLDFGAALEEAGPAAQRRRFPRAQLVGMDAALAGHLRDGLLLSEEFLD